MPIALRTLSITFLGILTILLNATPAFAAASAAEIEDKYSAKIVALTERHMGKVEVMVDKVEAKVDAMRARGTTEEKILAYINKNIASGMRAKAKIDTAIDATRGKGQAKLAKLGSPQTEVDALNATAADCITANQTSWDSANTALTALMTPE